MENFKAELSKDGKMLVIAIPYDVTGYDSPSGKSKVHASTHGNQSIAVDGKVVAIGINCFSKK